MVDSLVTYIKNENCKDFTMEYGKRLIQFYEIFNSMDFNMKYTNFCVCV